MTNNNLTSGLVTAYAVSLLAAGGLLLFVPEVVFPPGPVGMPPTALLVVQLLGAALLGLGAASWTAREAVLGGVYGRAVVVGNQAFAFIGVLVCLGNRPPGAGLPFWAFLLLLALGAVLFSILLFRPQWLLRNDGGRGTPDSRPPTPDS